jgi:hypothetical protein
LNFYVSFPDGVPTEQRAVVLAGGVALGAYQVGAIKALARELVEEDSKNGEKNIYSIVLLAHLLVE